MLSMREALRERGEKNTNKKLNETYFKFFKRFPSQKMRARIID